MKSKFRDFPGYAILFAIYPALNLLARNIGEVEYSIAYRVVFLSILVSGFSIYILYLVLHNWKKTGILSIAWFFAFFFYGHLFRYIKGLEVGSTLIGRHTYFMVIWLVFFLVITWLILKGSWQSTVILILRTMGVVLVILPLYQLISYQYGILRRNPVIPPEISVPTQQTGIPPDIYFIILDMYGRHDVLSEEFGYNDEFFLKQLKDMGFYVASCSQSNYHSTTYSLSATLNANYLHLLSDEFTPENRDAAPMLQLIQNSAVETVLRGRRYSVVAFETGYEWTEWEDADYFYTLQSNKINQFEDLWLRNTILSVFLEKGDLNNYLLTADQRKHDLSLYVLDELENVPLLPGPKFVFVHLTIPHPPFVVGSSGELEVIPPRQKNDEDYYLKEEYTIGYQNQLAFLNMRIPQIFLNIFAKSVQPPVIIVQGDHGPRFVETDKQVDILNAYYFPEPRPALYPSITPVNNFRLIFNTYFGASLPYLPDKSYASDLNRPYDFEEIPNDCTVDAS